jgi:hypothetical protein
MTRELEALRPLIEPYAHLPVYPEILNEAQQDGVESMPIPCNLIQVAGPIEGFHHAGLPGNSLHLAGIDRPLSAGVEKMQPPFPPVC